MENLDYRAGFIGLVGWPNAGKSSLLNSLVGEKVAAVSAKPQTTRQRVVGLITSDRGQIALVDAPGRVSDEKGLNRYLNSELAAVAEEADALVAVVASHEWGSDRSREIIEWTKNQGKPWLAVVSKVDLLPELLVAPRAEKAEPVFYHSALTPDLVPKWQPALLAALFDRLPVASGPLFDPDLYTTSSVRLLSQEIIREKCFELLFQEVPYLLAVRILRFVEDQGPVVRVFAEILVGKENHRRIVIGQGGKTIKQIGMASRLEIEKLVERPVYLDLHVKVRQAWLRDQNIMAELGYAAN